MLDRSPNPPRPAWPQPPATTALTVTPARQVGPYAAPLVPADTKALFGQLLKILFKQRWKLLFFVASAVALAIALQLTFPRLYSASALLRLDRHSAPGAVGQEASQTSAINDMDVIIDTDIAVAQSDPVLRPVAEKYRLIDYDKPASFLDRLLGKKPDAQAIRRAKMAAVELPGLKVTRPPNTYLIRITYRAWRQPQLAAAVANAVAQSLLKHVHQSLDQSYDDLTSAMRRDMDQLHSKMDDSSKKLTQYEKELNMVDPEQRSTVLTSRLTQLLAEYTAAQADRLHKQAELDGISKSPTLADTEATEADRQRQSLLDEALEHLATARQQFVAARSYYGESHPEYRKAKQELDEAESEVDKMRLAANAKAEAEYRQAFEREVLLKHQLDQAKSEVDGLKAHALAYAQLKTEAENDRRMYMDLETHMREVDVNRQYRDESIQFVAPALPPSDAVFPKLRVNLPIAFFLALLLGILGAIAADALDNTFEDADEVSARMRLQVLGALPDDMKQLAAKGEPAALLPAVYNRSSERGSLYAERSAGYEEAIRMLRNSIGSNRALRTVLITSGCLGEGKSTTAAHLSAACARGGKKVLLIDADLRRPSLHKKFGMTKRIGLVDVLTHRTSPMDVIAEADVPGLFVLPAGVPAANAADLINLGFSGVLSKVRSNFDLVIVDAPPTLGVSETQEIAAMVDGVLVMARAQVTSAQDLEETVATLRRSGANVLGVVMNQVKPSALKRPGYFYRQYRQEDQA